jgi:hypothetical protein
MRKRKSTEGWGLLAAGLRQGREAPSGGALKIPGPPSSFPAPRLVRPYPPRMRVPLRSLFPVAALLAALLAGGPAAGQPLPPDTLRTPSYATGFGGTVLLTNSGFGFGGLVRYGVGRTTSLVAEASLGAGKDEREQEFFTGPFGETVTPFKRHHFLMVPLGAGIEQRLWARAIEDDFRPFLLALAGPVFGYQWPYFDDINANGIRDPGEPKRGAFDLSGGSFRLGVGGVLALGAYFGDGPSAVGLRIGYAAQYFPEPVELLEPRPEIERPDRRYFGTPVVSFHFLRLR